MTELLPSIALAFFPLTVIWAAIGDLTTMRIPNRLVLTMLLGFVLLAPLVGFTLTQIVSSVAAAAVVFCLGFAVFALGGMGGGDVKLMAVAALWLGLPQVGAFLLWTSLVGALLTVALMAYRSLPLSRTVLAFDWAYRLHATETRVPYGVAIASAALIVFTASPWMALR